MISYIKKIIDDPSIEICEINRDPPQYTTYPEKYFIYLSASIEKVYPGASVIPMLFPASNDNSYFRSSGCPVYGLNPMIVSTEQINSVHNYDEYIDFEDIELGSKVFKEFLSVLMFESVIVRNTDQKIIR